MPKTVKVCEILPRSGPSHCKAKFQRDFNELFSVIHARTFPPRGTYQCDQMTKLLFWYLAICNNENYPNSTWNLPKYVIILTNTKKMLFQLSRSFKTWPQWRYFVESGHNGLYVAMWRQQTNNLLLAYQVKARPIHLSD